MELAAIVGIVAGTSVLNNIVSIATSTSKVDTCVDAYYADKFNGERAGHPSKTFLKCMQTNYPETFKEAKKRYDSPASTGAAGQ